MENVVKVANTSNVNSVAGMIANLLKTNSRVEVNAIGAGALNQAVKAVAVARGYVAPLGVNLVCIPAFTDVDVGGVDRTGIKLIVKEEK